MLALSTEEGPLGSSTSFAEDPSFAEDEQPAGMREEIQRLRAENAAAQREIAELKEAVAARDAFIATAGHELRNAMGGVLVAATYLHSRANGVEGLPPWIGERLAMIARQSRGFVRRATTLLDVSRLTTGGLRLTPAPVALGAICEAVRDELGPEAELARCDLDFASCDGIVGCWDREAIEQILINLVSNAIKYGAGKPVHVVGSVEGSNATVRVRDHGMGISEPDRERIFARFERAVRSGELPGFGIGLWIARQLARAHRGDIQVEGAPGQGSIFTVQLPGVIHEPHR